MSASFDEAGVARPSHRELTCPICGSKDLVPILYGLPNVRIQHAGQAGEVPIGACLRDDESAWHCRACGTDSQDHPRPSRFAVFDADASADDIAAWIVSETSDTPDQP